MAISKTYLRVAGMEGEPNPPMTASFWAQMKSTLIRNLIRKKRNKRHTLRELLGPIYFLAVIIVLKLALGNPRYPPVISPPGSDQALSPGLLSGKHVAVAPNTPEVAAFMAFFIKKFSPRFNYTLYQSETAIEEMYESNHSSVGLALIFHKLDTDLVYKIRVSSDSSFSMFSLPPAGELFSSQGQCRGQKPEKKEFISQIGGAQKMLANIPSFLSSDLQGFSFDGLEYPVSCPGTAYYYSGFSTLQLLVENAWLLRKNPSHETPHVELLQLPKDAYTGTMETVLRSILPLYMTISVSQFLTPMLMVVVLEKEKKIKESLRMVGLRDSVFWLSWFLVYAILIFCISIIGSTLVNFVVFSTTRTYYPVLFVLMLEFGLSIIMFAFVMTALFSKAKAAGLAGGLTILLISCLYYLQVFLKNSPEWVFWLLGLLSPTTFAMSMDRILKYDLDGRSLTVEMLWDTSLQGMPLGGAMIMIGIDIVLYGLLAAWLDNIIPTEYGTNRKPWFCFTPSYWMSAGAKKAVSTEEHLVEGADIEKVAHNMEGTAAIVISGLRKSFTAINKKPVHAVQDVSLKIYPGEITAILGHNGAGKSTLFNMLTGMTAPSGGKAHIFGYDVRDHDQMEEIRKMTGICPQHDVLFDELTPREHLQFFARIRGMSEADVAEEVNTILTDIDLLDKADSIAEKLSGGQKRKLSVGIALIGDPKLIFLDEPTAGVDPYSRRHMWSVLKKRKEGKVILLTTHFMDEADILADRKAILSRGRVRCYGSSLFLKNRFGIGYHLTMVMKRERGGADIQSLVTGSVPGAELARHHGKEISFVLPRDQVTAFPPLFHQIEENMKTGDTGMGISSYGVSMTTLEEVFLHLGEEEEGGEQGEEEQEEGGCASWFQRKQGRKVGYSNGDLTEQDVRRRASVGSLGASGNGGSVGHATGIANGDLKGYSFESVATRQSAWQAYKALVYIRFIRKFREPGAIIVQMILPIVYVCIGVLLSDSGNKIETQDTELIISPNLYSSKFSNYFHGFQNPSGEPVPDEALFHQFEEYTNRSFKRIPGDASYASLLNSDLFAVLNYTAHFLDLEVEGIYNDTAQHAIPVLLNSLSNAYARLYNLGVIELTSQPFRLTQPPQSFDGSSFGGGMLVGLTYIFIPIGLALELIEDREVRAKNQLRVNGLSFVIYFGSFFTVLGGMLLVLLCVLLCLVVAFDFAALMIPAGFFVFASMYLLYTLPALLFSACCSYLFDTIESGQFLFPIASYAGFIPYIAVFIAEAYGYADWAKAMHIGFAFISPIYVPFGVIMYVTKQYIVCSIGKTCDALTVRDYMIPEVYVLYIALLFHTVLWALVLRIVDTLKDGGSLKDIFGTRIRSSHVVETPADVTDEDADVREERIKVASIMAHRSPAEEVPVITVQSLRKVFRSGVNTRSRRRPPCFGGSEAVENGGVKVAVKNLSLSVKAGEVFGLLGHNGAGKTTTMRIIVAEEAPTAGRIRIGSRDILSNQSEAFQELGYCPQFDCVWKTITVREHLETYAAIRGVPPNQISGLVKRYMEGLHIMEHANKHAKDCSGGTKRKLSYAMAMLGNPRIVLLDEPSTGMDPQSKRFVWNTVEASFRSSRGAVLTTHSMEEADALCSRVGIMVKGELRCLGSTQHLKNKYGAGYTLEVKWRAGQQADWPRLELFLQSTFPGLEVNESFADRRSYNVRQAAVTSLAVAFQHLQLCTQEFDVEDYSFSQTTLEQVFIEFAKQQEMEDQQDNEQQEADSTRKRTTHF